MVIFANAYPIQMLSFPHTHPGGTTILHQIVINQKPITVLLEMPQPLHAVDDIVVDLLRLGSLKKDFPVGHSDVV